MASGVGLNEACKQVAAETDKEHGYFWNGDLLGQKIMRRELDIKLTSPHSTTQYLLHLQLSYPKQEGEWRLYIVHGL